MGGPACRLSVGQRGEAFAIRWKNDQLLKSQVDKSAKSVKWHPVPSGGDGKHRWAEQSANYISEEDAKYLNACLVPIRIRGNFMRLGFMGSKTCVPSSFLLSLREGAVSVFYLVAGNG